MTTATGSDTLIATRDLHKWFEDNHVLKGIDFSVQRGEVVCVVGPSGSGKSTLLRCLNVLEHPQQGEVVFGDENLVDPDCDIDAARRHIGMVFQQFNLFPLHDALNNCTTAPRTVLGMRKDEAERIARERLIEVGLADKVNASPASLSGGQKQRVMLARALALEPQILLLDEFTARVDAQTEGKILHNVTENYPDIALLSITQTIEPVKDYDQIILLMQGEVIAKGTHRELIKDSPEYNQIYQSQRSTSQYELQSV